MRSTPARVIIVTSVAASIGWPWCTRPPAPEYSPSVFSRTITQSRSCGRQRLSGASIPGKMRVGAHVGILIESLADLQAQAPQRDVVRNVPVARGPEKDGVFAAQRIQSALRHHRAVLPIVVAAPVEIFEFEFKLIQCPGQHLEHLPPRGHNFLADAVAGNGGDAIGLQRETSRARRRIIGTNHKALRCSS